MEEPIKYIYAVPIPTERGGLVVKRDEKGRIVAGSASLNPGGKPQGSKNFTTLIKEAFEAIGELQKRGADRVELEMHMQAVYRAFLDHRDYKYITEQQHGKATQKLDVVSGGEKLTLTAPQTIKNLAHEYSERVVNGE